ncbi:hypothetical protein SAMN05444162_5010 [Paenibacillaceae bacterium GAS479]|nr:hypothetical protein SAMN05444162_5010 [Paenibacillaceae bacterium GAS479]
MKLRQGTPEEAGLSSKKIFRMEKMVEEWANNKV